MIQYDARVTNYHTIKYTVALAGDYFLPVVSGSTTKMTGCAFGRDDPSVPCPTSGQYTLKGATPFPPWHLEQKMDSKHSVEYEYLDTEDMSRTTVPLRSWLLLISLVSRPDPSTLPFIAMGFDLSLVSMIVIAQSSKTRRQH